MKALLLLAAVIALLFVIAPRFVVSSPWPGLRTRFDQVMRNLASELGELDLVENKISSAEIRNQLLEKADRLRELRGTPEDKRTDTYANDLRQTNAEVLDLSAEFDARRGVEQYDAQRTAWEHALAEAADPNNRGRGNGGPSAAFDEHEDEHRSAGAEFTALAEYEEYRGRNEASKIPFEAEVRTLLDSGVQVFTNTDAGMWRPVGTPLPPMIRQQRLFVRDVINVIETGLSAVPYIRELKPATTEGGATAIGEAVTKPEVEMDFEQDTAIVKKIAAWIPATEEIIEDAPTLRGYIDTRLSYMLALREEAQVLNGSGNGPNIKGIRQYSGLQTQGTVNTEYPATIGKAIAKIELVDGEGDFVATNPSDFWVAVTTRHATQLDAGFSGASQPAPVGPVALYVPTWGLSTVRTRSMEAGKALVGSRMGATIADRKRTVIRVGNQHSTFFVENKIAILAEERVGLLVHRPDLFVEASVPTS